MAHREYGELGDLNRHRHTATQKTGNQVPTV